jgi:hypothetical protein
MKRTAILQSSYIPWKGYFDIINMVDEFILYDDMQYTKNDWRNRNRIKSHTGTAWMTIPVSLKGRFGQRIRDVEVNDPRWSAKHWKSIQVHYARAPYFKALRPILQELYERAAKEVLLSKINEIFIRGICDLLGIRTQITRSMDYELKGDRVECLVSLCEQSGAGQYLSGPAAKGYLEEQVFTAKDIEVLWMDYTGYPEYRQLFAPPLIHEVTILDLLLNEGVEEAPRFLLSMRDV